MIVGAFYPTELAIFINSFIKERAAKKEIPCYY